MARRDLAAVVFVLLGMACAAAPERRAPRALPAPAPVDVVAEVPSRECPHGEAQAGAHIDPTPIRDAVHAGAGAVRACYESALARDATAEGKAVFTWIVATDGRVAHVWLGESSSELGYEPAFAECMMTEICRWRFPPNRRGTVQVTYPFRFQRSSASSRPTD